MMKNSKLIFSAALLFVFAGAAVVQAQSLVSDIRVAAANAQFKEKKVLYFNPEVYPDVEDIKVPTNAAFFSSVSDNMSQKSQLLRADAPIVFDSVDTALVAEYCKNNGADYAVVPKVKYFKVGLGKYIFSNQVIVSMKLFDSTGKFITETHYDTYKKNIRLLGSAENSVKIGTKGAYKDMLRSFRGIIANPKTGV